MYTGPNLGLVYVVWSYVNGSSPNCVGDQADFGCLFNHINKSWGRPVCRPLAIKQPTPITSRRFETCGRFKTYGRCNPRISLRRLHLRLEALLLDSISNKIVMSEPCAGEFCGF